MLRTWRRLALVAGLLLGWPGWGLAASAAEDEALLKKAGNAIDGPGLLAWFRSQTPSPQEQLHIKTLIQQLGHDDFGQRQKASAELRAMGPGIAALLRQGLENPDEEIQERLRECLARLKVQEQLARTAAAARLLRGRAPAETVSVLLVFLACCGTETAARAPSEILSVQEELAITLAVVGVKEGKIDPALVAALHDRNAACRGAAGLVLGRSGTAEQRKAVQLLLADGDPLVRLLAAQGLLAARDRAAVPVLIALLGDGPDDLAIWASDLLGCIAIRGFPQVALSRDKQLRIRYRRSWELWWRQYGPADLARAEVDLPPFNAALQMRLGVRRWLNALARGDTEAIKKGVDVPFYSTSPAQGAQALNTPEEVANFFGQGKMIVSNPLFTLGETIDLESYLRRLPAADVANVRKTRLKTSELRVLCCWLEMPIEQPRRPRRMAEPVAVPQAFLLLRGRGDQVRIAGGWEAESRKPW